jgi:hypothetical protein
MKATEQAFGVWKKKFLSAGTKTMLQKHEIFIWSLQHSYA